MRTFYGSLCACVNSGAQAPPEAAWERGYVFACARCGHAQGKGSGYGVNGQVFGRLRRNVGGTNQIADRVIGHQRSCEYHAVCVIFTMRARERRNVSDIASLALLVDIYGRGVEGFNCVSSCVAAATGSRRQQRR